MPTSVEALNTFGERLVSFLNRPEIVKAGDLMAVTAAEHPSLAAAFYAAGPEAVAALVVKFLRSLEARGLISVGEVDLADPAPNPLDIFMFYSHPAIPDRVRFALSYDPWSQGGQSEFVK